MRNLFFSTIALLFPWNLAPLRAAEPAPTNVQIARLESLCRVWGVVKFFHPWIIDPPDGKPIDWDAALVETIPLVERAATAEEFRAAIDHLLSALHDPATRVARQNLTQPSVEPALPQTKSIESGGKKILVISAANWRRLSAQERKSPGNLFTEAFAQAVDADAIVLDLRNKADNWLILLNGSRLSNLSLRSNIAALLKADLPLPTVRSRFHKGYESEDVPNNAYRYDRGIYHSGFLTRENAFLRAKPGPSAGKRLIILTSTATQCEFSVLAALQSSGQATIIHDSADFSNFVGDESVYGMQVGENVWATIRTADDVNGDGTLGLMPGAVVERPNGEGDDPAMRTAFAIACGESPPPNRSAPRRAASPKRPIENSYPEMVSPNREYRLLGLFRVWNVIHYFFAYKELMDHSWDSLLTEFIPRFAKVESGEDYGLLANELLAHLQDAHVGATGGLAAAARDHRLGYPLSTILLRPIRGAMVVVSADASVQDRVHVGDVVLAIDGEPVAARSERLKKYISAPTQHALDLALCYSVLLGPADSPARLKLRTPEGTVREASLPRSRDQSDGPAWRGVYQYPSRDRKTPEFSVLPEGYGYVDLIKLTGKDTETAYNALKEASALIIDMRGYGGDGAIISRLTDKSTTTAMGRAPYWTSPGSTLSGDTWLTSHQMLRSISRDNYKGRVIVLINSEARSFSEHLCLSLEEAAKGRITFLGTPTVGSNGSITFTSMPGGIAVRFSGADIRHADGRQLQRVGIQPDIRVEPTVAGIAAGKDEVLEAAIKFLNGSKAG
jgi:C-terminal processing protease CtpA/Prc